jgi:hypothetical protein
MESIEFHSFNPKEFNAYVSDPEKRRNQLLIWAIIGIIGALAFATRCILKYKINHEVPKYSPKK